MGTFTSLQGADGQLIPWRALENAKLPGFVYTWQKPGLDRRIMSAFGGKGVTATLQRMETPVIYFYTDEMRTVDVRVKFPEGLVTEWYPQAQQMGPSIAIIKQPEVASRDALFAMNLQPMVTATNAFTASESIIHWPEVKLLPSKDLQNLKLRLEKSGSHYFAARETNSAGVRLNSAAPPEVQMEEEKFLFYRGVGNFKTPLRATIGSGGSVTLKNEGKGKLPHLFLLGVENGSGKFIQVSNRESQDKRTVELEFSKGAQSLDKLQKEISTQMEAALVSEGLFRHEAEAMVNTWQDSWFTENGWRVLYILPRTWTDETLPMELNPKPKQLVRVMVGRAELIHPSVEQNINAQVDKAMRGEASELQASLKKLGRFAEPIFYRAVTAANASNDQRNRLSKVFYESTRLN